MPTIVAYLILLTLITPPLGAFMYRVYTSEKIGRVEGVIYRLIGVDPRANRRGGVTRRASCGSARSR